MAIDSFQGENRFLSNFATSRIRVRVGGVDIDALTVEHAYQALKATNANDRLKVLNAGTPGSAKKAGKEIQIREDWQQVKVKFMRALVLSKFEQNPHLAERLLATGDEELIEGNWWGDRFWGVCRGVGDNQLGKILMWVRATLRRRQPLEVVAEESIGEDESEVGSVGHTVMLEVDTPLPEVPASAPTYSGRFAVLDQYLDEVGIYSFPWQWIKNPLFREVARIPGVYDEIIARMEKGDIHWPFFSLLAREFNFRPFPMEEQGYVRKIAERWVAWYRRREDPQFWYELAEEGLFPVGNEIVRVASDGPSEQESAEEGA